jgi:3'-phosphoadenosine 5'-phosphosulfate sulfotransferase (PAPS reductase)/FAD synthetase
MTRDREAEKQRKKFLYVSPEEIDHLSLDDCIDISNKIINLADELYPNTVAKFALFSGGNDSLVNFYITKDYIDHVIHINTGIGIEETRDFVRNVCKMHGKNLIERKPPDDCSYEKLILQYGFPSANLHYLMYNRLKERALRTVRNDFVKRKRKDVIQYFTGVRYAESTRRNKTTDDIMKDGSVVWVAPIAHWSNKNVSEYRKKFNLPINDVTVNLHMSGECLCGSFAKKNELEQIRFFYPKTAEYIESLQDLVKENGNARCVWGDNEKKKKIVKQSGILCTSCDEEYINSQDL